MTTLNEVAELAGVTAATVSNVLRKRGKVGEQTRLRVLAAVDQLGYRPHLTARALAEGGALNAAADLGLKVPQDISIIGITDIQWARLARPALTTVAVPTTSAAELAIKLLLELISNAGKGTPMRVTDTPQLIIRASTGVVRK